MVYVLKTQYNAYKMRNYAGNALWLAGQYLKKLVLYQSIDLYQFFQHAESSVKKLHGNCVWESLNQNFAK